MNPKVSRTELARVITAKLLSEPARHAHWMQVLASYLVENERVAEADLLMNDIAHELYVQASTLNAEVTSAETLTEETKQELADFLKSRTGAESVQLHETVDPEVLGGLIARTPDEELDVSVRNSLRQLTALAG